MDDIWAYIAQDNIDAADRWIGKLFDAFEAVGRSPGSEIIAVTQGARDIPSFLIASEL